MKKINNILSFSLLFLIFISCGKEGTFIEKETSPSDIKVNLELSDLEAQAIISNSKEGFLDIESDNQYIAFLNYIENSSIEKIEELKENLDFETFEDKISSLYDELDIFENEQDFLDFISEQNDYFELQTLENGEKELVEKNQIIHSIGDFLNSDKIVKVGSTYKKYIGDFCVHSNDYQELIELNTIQEIENSKLFYFEATKLINTNNNSADIRASNDLGYKRTWSATKDKRRCKNDRKVIFEANFFVTQENGPLGIIMQRIAPKLKVIAHKKSFCVWVEYKTNITWNDFSFKYYINGNEYLWTLSNIYQTNTKSITRTGGTNQAWLSFSETHTACWKEMESSVSHQGMGGQFLNINQSYSDCQL